MITNLRDLLNEYRYLPAKDREIIAAAWRAARERKRFALYIQGHHGSGKTLLARRILAPHFGEPAVTDVSCGWPSSLSELAPGGYWFVDNYFYRPFFHGSLCRVLTSDRISERALHRRQEVDIPNNLVVIIAGNGAPPKDMARRRRIIELPAATGPRTIVAPGRDELRAATKALAARIDLAQEYFDRLKECREVLRAADDDIREHLQVAKFNLRGEMHTGEVIPKPTKPTLISESGIIGSEAVRNKIRTVLKLIAPLLEEKGGK